MKNKTIMKNKTGVDDAKTVKALKHEKYRRKRKQKKQTHAQKRINNSTFKNTMCSPNQNFNGRYRVYARIHTWNFRRVLTRTQSLRSHTHNKKNGLVLSIHGVYSPGNLITFSGPLRILLNLNNFVGVYCFDNDSAPTNHNPVFLRFLEGTDQLFFEFPFQRVHFQI